MGSLRLCISWAVIAPRLGYVCDESQVCTSFTQSEVEIEGSIICSISNTSKGLCDCSEGVRFTHCDIENPPPPFLQLVRAPRRLHPFVPTALGSRPPVRPHACVGCHTGGGIPA